jgi:hypothetical protein
MIENSLERLREKMVQLLTTESLYLRDKSYGTVLEIENGQEVYRRIEYGATKAHHYNAQFDWKQASNVERGKAARVRVKKIIKELSKLLEEAKSIVKEKTAERKLVTQAKRSENTINKIKPRQK